MSTRDADRKRKRAYEEGVMPQTVSAGRVLSDGTAIEAHEVELDALERIERGERSAWDVLAAEALAQKCFDAGCAIADGGAGACPGWCSAAIAGSGGVGDGLMSRVNPKDVGMPEGSRVYKSGSAVGFENLHALLPANGMACPRCGRPMGKHGSRTKKMRHAVGKSPCELELEIPRYRCEKCGITRSEQIGFASVLSPNVTAALEERILELLGERRLVKEVAALCEVPYATVRLVIDGATVRKPELPRVLLMDEIHAYSYREDETGKLVAVYWTVAYDGKGGHVVDVIEGHDAPALDAWYSQFTPEERNRVKAFCSDMFDPFLAAAAKWLPLAIRAVDRFHVAKDGVAHLDKARRRIQKGAGNGAAIKRWHRKLAVNRGKRRREHAGEALAENEKATICNLLCICDSKHSHLRQAYLALQLYYIWQDKTWGDRGACDKALSDWVMKASSLPVPETAAFARTVNQHRQLLVTGTVKHINSARAESTNDKIKELKKRGRGFGGFEETRKRILIAFGKPGAVESATSKALRIKRAAERKAAGKKARGRKGKRR